MEAIFLSTLIGLVGVGAVLLPLALRRTPVPGRPVAWTWRVVGGCWAAAGVVLTLFGALNYYTHIGLILNTMAGPSS